MTDLEKVFKIFDMYEDMLIDNRRYAIYEDISKVDYAIKEIRCLRSYIEDHLNEL